MASIIKSYFFFLTSIGDLRSIGDFLSSFSFYDSGEATIVFYFLSFDGFLVTYFFYGFLIVGLAPELLFKSWSYYYSFPMVLSGE